MGPILLVTVTKVESRAVLKVVTDATIQKPRPAEIDGRIYFDLGVIQGARLWLTQSEMGAGGLDASLLTVRKGIESLSPMGVIMVGIAFGVNEEKQAIGDILVATQLRLYDLQRVGAQIILRGDKAHASPRLLSRMRSADLQWDGARVRFDVVLTGEKLVDSIDFRDQLRGFEPEAIGGEMEGAGLYVACQDAKVDWILVKAICDWADGNKERDRDSRQQTAAGNAAKFVLHSLQFAPFEGYSSVQAASHSTLPVQSFFFGREKELAIIADEISPDSRSWGVLIDGPGGIGKTALAVRAGHLAPAAHHPHKIFLSAKKRELTPEGEQELEDFMLPNYVALLSEIARELGDAEVALIPENERANAVRRLLGSARVLFVIDNVETFPDRERVRLYQFLGRLPGGCKAIVTSRRRTDVAARVIPLDRMEAKDALELLAEIAKTNHLLAEATEEERQTVYEVTGGNPLLIRWTAGQLGRYGSQCRTIADACGYLNKAPLGNDPLEYIFGDLLDSFTDTETAVLAALTHFNEPAQVRWIVSMTGLPWRQTHTALDDLADRALLAGTPGSEAFHLSPLAARFMKEKRPDAVAETGDRLVEYVYNLALENGYQNYEQFSAIEMEWPAVYAAMPIFAERENARLQELCVALRNFLDFYGRWDEWLWIEQQAEERARGINDHYNAGWRAYYAGFIYHLRAQATNVLCCADRAEAEWKKAGAGAREQGHAFRLRGIGHRVARNYTAAHEAVRQALDLFITSDPDSDDVMKCLNSLAEAEKAAGDWAAAEGNYREALRIAKKVEHREGIADITRNLADLSVDRKDWASAEQLAREALALADALGRQELIGYSSYCLATSLLRQGRATEGLAHARRAVEIFERLRMLDALETARTTLRDCEGID